MKTLTIPTQDNRFGLSKRAVHRYIQTLRGKTPKSWAAPTLPPRARKRNAWHAGHCHDGVVGLETASRDGEVLVTRMGRKPPTWLVEVPTPDGQSILKMVLVKGGKGTARKTRWMLTGPGIVALFPSRRAALAASREVIEVQPEEETNE